MSSFEKKIIANVSCWKLFYFVFTLLCLLSNVYLSVFPCSHFYTDSYRFLMSKAELTKKKNMLKYDILLAFRIVLLLKYIFEHTFGSVSFCVVSWVNICKLTLIYFWAQNGRLTNWALKKWLLIQGRYKDFKEIIIYYIYHI